MIYDYFRVIGAHDTVLDFGDFIIYRSSNRRRYEKGLILLSMTKIPPTDVLESLYTLRIRESAQLRVVLELYEIEIHQKISRPNCETLKPEMRELRQGRWLRVAGD